MAFALRGILQSLTPAILLALGAGLSHDPCGTIEAIGIAPGVGRHRHACRGGPGGPAGKALATWIEADPPQRRLRRQASTLAATAAASVLA